MTPEVRGALDGGGGAGAGEGQDRARIAVERLTHLAEGDGRGTVVAALRDAAGFVDAVGIETYPPDVFIPPTPDQLRQVNELLQRERGHQLDGIAAECMRRAYAVAARRLYELADDIAEDQP